MKFGVIRTFYSQLPENRTFFSMNIINFINQWIYTEIIPVNSASSRISLIIYNYLIDFNAMW